MTRRLIAGLLTLCMLVSLCPPNAFAIRSSATDIHVTEPAVVETQAEETETKETEPAPTETKATEPKPTEAEEEKPKTVSVKVDETITLTATAEAGGSWSSSNNAAATAVGRVEGGATQNTADVFGVAEGFTTVTYTLGDSVEVWNVTVTAAPAEEPTEETEPADEEPADVTYTVTRLLQEEAPEGSEEPFIFSPIDKITVTGKPGADVTLPAVPGAVAVNTDAEEVLPNEDGTATLTLPAETPEELSLTVYYVTAESLGEASTLDIIEKTTPRATFNFVNADGSPFIFTLSGTENKTSRQIVLNGETLVKPVDPVMEGFKFVGWKRVDNGAFFNFSETVSVTADVTYTLKATFVELVSVRFLDTDGTTCISELAVGAGEDVSWTGISAAPVISTQKFSGWSTTKDAETAEYGEDGQIEKVTENITLYPVFESAYTITFVLPEGAQYVAPRQYFTSYVLQESDAPVTQWTGYTFEGWFTDEACTDNSKFNWDHALTGDINLYPKFTAAATQYSITVWKQSINDSVNAENKTYDYESSEKIDANTGEIVSVPDSYKGYDFTGFHYDRCDEEKTVAADGTTVLNVYFDRDVMTINFSRRNFRLGYQGVNTLYGNRNGTDWRKSEDSSHTYTYTWDGTGYERTRYGYSTYLTVTDWTTIWEDGVDHSYKGLYGQKLTQGVNDDGEAYTGWPDSYSWEEDDGTGMSYLDAFIFPNNEEIFNLYSENNASETYFVYQVLQDKEGKYTKTITTRGNGGNFNITKKFDGFEPIGWDTSLKENGPSNAAAAGDRVSIGSYDNVLYIYNKRLSYTVEFVDPVTNKTIGDSLNVLYEDKIAKPATDPVSTRDGYYFTGWYKDSTCQVPFDFATETMPANNLAIYAGWAADGYQIDLYPNGGTLPAGQSASFWLDFDETMDAASPVWAENGKDVATFTGWYIVKADGTKEAYVMGSRITDDDVFTTIDGVKHVHIQASWKMIGTYTLTIFYTDGEGNDMTLSGAGYADGAAAVTPTAVPNTPTGKTLVGWTLPDGTELGLGATFTVNAATMGTVTEDGNYIIRIEPIFADNASLNVTAIQYNANGGEGTIAAQTGIEINDSVTLSNGAGFTKTGYRIIGWSKTSGEGNSADFNLGASCIANNIGLPGQVNTLYAVWEKAEFDVTYKYEGEVPTGAPAVPDKQTKTLDDTVHVASIPTLPGYTFSGWTSEDVAVADGKFKMPANDVVFTGSWEKDESQTKTLTYTVQHKIGDEVKDSQDYTETVWVNDPDTITVQAGSLDKNTYIGYKFSSMDPEVAVGEKIADKSVITLTYVKKTDLTYTVNYYWMGTTTKVADSKLVDKQTFDAEVTESAIDVTGYTKVDTKEHPASVTFHVTDPGNVINFYYYKNVELTANSGVRVYNGDVQTITGFTGAPEGVTFDGVTASGSGKDVSVTPYDVTFSDGTVGKVDTSSKYIVTAANPGTLTIVSQSINPNDPPVPTDPDSINPDQPYYIGIIVEDPDDVMYNGQSQKGLPVVEDSKGNVLVKDKDYTLSYSDDTVNVGTVTVTITGIGNYQGVFIHMEGSGDGLYTRPVTYQITKRLVTLTSEGGTKAYDGTALTKPDVKVEGDGFVAGEVSGITATGSVTYVSEGEVTNSITYTTGANFKADNYTINKIEGKLSITANTNEIVITADSASKTYDGTALTKSTYTYTDGVLAAGDELQVVVTGSQTDAGSSANVVTSYKVMRGETDVTANYTFGTSVNGTLTVNKRTVTLTSESASKVYDETALTRPDVTVSGEGFVAGEVTNITAIGTITDAGSVTNTISFTPTTAFKESNYQISKSEGTLTVTKQSINPVGPDPEKPDPNYLGVTVGNLEDVVYNGKTQEQKPAVTDKGGNALAENTDYTLSWSPATNVGTVTVTVTGIGNYTGTVTRTYEITKAPYTVTTYSAIKVYDGNPLTAGGIVNGLVNGETCTVNTTASRTEYGTTQNKPYTLTWGTAQESNYEFKGETIGTLTVLRQSINPTDPEIPTDPDGEKPIDPNQPYYGGVEVKAPENVKYNGKSQEQKPVVTDKDGTALVENTDYTLSYSEDTVNAGTVTVTVTGKGNYQGKVEVTYQITKRPVSLKSESGTKVYDGTPLTKPGVVVGEKGFVDGEVTEIIATGTVTNVSEGTVANTITFTPGENFKASNYQITKVEGELYVTQAAEGTVTVYGNTANLVWTGDEQEVTGFTHNGAARLITVTIDDPDNASARGTDVGRYYMDLTAKNFTASSPNYKTVKVVVVDGYLDIVTINITVTVTVRGNSETVTYDGQPHTVTGYKVVSAIANTGRDMGMDGFTLKFNGDDSVTGTEVGTYAMGLSAADFTITSNIYRVVRVVVEDGGLEITPAPEEIPEPTETIPDETVPLAPPEEIPDEPVPQAGPAWALINLILSILTVLASLLLLVGFFGKKEEEAQDENGNAILDAEGNNVMNDIKKRGGWRLASLVPAILSVIAFLLTENMRNPMILVDRWTLLMVIIAVVQVLVMLLSKKKTEDNTQEA